MGGLGVQGRLSVMVVALVLHMNAWGQQCSPHAVAGEGVTDLMLYSSEPQISELVEWDPDGAGPRPSGVVVGGTFRVAGTSVVNGIAFCDDTSLRWEGFGPQDEYVLPPSQSGLPVPAFRTATAIAVMQDGSLVAAGTRGDPASPEYGVSRWTGTQWISMGEGFSGGVVRVLHVRQNGELVAGGDFTLVGTQSRSCITRWDGQSWEGYGQGASVNSLPLPVVEAIASMSDGSMIVGGRFDSIADVPMSNIAKHDGTNWSGLGEGILGTVRSLTLRRDGTLLVGGSFFGAGGVGRKGIALWTGSAWSPEVPGLVQGSIEEIVEIEGATSPENPRLFAFGSANVPPQYLSTGVIALENNEWRRAGSIGDIRGRVRTFALDANRLLIGGEQRPLLLLDLTTYRTRNWTPGATRTQHSPAASSSGTMWSLATSPTGPAPTRSVLQRRSEGSWIEVAEASPNASGVFVRASGEVLVGSGALLARLSDQGLEELPPIYPGFVGRPRGFVENATTGTVTFIATYASGNSYVHQWDGTRMVQLGTRLNSDVEGQFLTALAETSHGLYVSGSFIYPADTRVRSFGRWNGFEWEPVAGSLEQPVFGMVALADGRVLVVQSDGTARTFDGTTWEPWANGFITALTIGRSGTVLGLQSSGRATRVVESSGQSWTPVTGPVDENLFSAIYSYKIIPQLVASVRGDLAVAGRFTTSEAVVSANFALWEVPTECPTACDPIDFDNDGVFPDEGDLTAYLSVLSGGPCPTFLCNDLDFNNNGIVPEDEDLSAFLRVLAAGPCG